MTGPKPGLVPDANAIVEEVAAATRELVDLANLAEGGPVIPATPV